MKPIQNLSKQVESRFWTYWCLAICIISLIQLLTIAYSPIVYTDESYILDYGRMVLDPETDWSIVWIIAKNKPFFPVFYVGSLLNEVFLRISGYSLWGPRIVGLLQGVFLSGVVSKLMLSEKHTKIFSLLVSVTFFLDPIVVFSYRSGRVDTWVLSFSLLSLWFLNHSTQVERKFSKVTSIMGAGFCVSLAFYIWPSAVIIYPLVFASALNISKQVEKSSRSYFFLNFLGAILVSFLILSVPIFHSFLQALSGVFEVAAVSRSGNQLISQAMSQLIAFIPSMQLSPFLFFLLCASFFGIQNRFWIFSTLFAISMCLVTGVYPFRVIYLVPYAIVLFSQTNLQLHSNDRMKKFMTVVICVYLAWSVTFSLLVRTYLGLSQRNYREHEKIEHIARDYVGIGSERRVYDKTLQFYYVGRSSKWKMFRPASFYVSPENREEQYKDFLKRVDYIICFNNNPKANVDTFLENDEKIIQESGFQLKDTVPYPDLDNLPVVDKTPLGGGLVYGGYKIYHRIELQSET